MAQFNAISARSLMRLIGTGAAPAILDVRLDEDVDDIPFMLPTARKTSIDRIDDLAPDLRDRNVVVVCHKGLKLSHGAAALLRTHGVRADVLEGGAVGWAEEGWPAIPREVVPRSAPGSLWVTKQRPKIDRIACPWLIRRFIDPDARFLFVPGKEVPAVAERFGAIAFDVPGAPWGHADDLCTFDALLAGFHLETEPLQTLARIVRGADTDTHDLAPECAGLLAMSVGLSRAYADDLAQLEAGLGLYDALYRWARDGQDEGHAWPGQHA